MIFAHFFLTQSISSYQINLPWFVFTREIFILKIMKTVHSSKAPSINVSLVSRVMKYRHKTRFPTSLILWKFNSCYTKIYFDSLNVLCQLIGHFFLHIMVHDEIWWFQKYSSCLFLIFVVSRSCEILSFSYPKPKRSTASFMQL